ncbi:MAG: hypothetical protein PHF07_01045 [Candidatus Pacebacteria bacterium]|nr:hypothetical protein [Candidatus Paceibacterota bacterium]
MKIFLISPVRNVSSKEREEIRAYVARLEGRGHKVHWPERDTDQQDKIGLRIITDNKNALAAADEIHIWWQWEEKEWWQKLFWWIKEKKSTGSLFDFGMAFALGKRILLANYQSVNATPQKSFNNVLLKLHKKA